MNQDLSDRTTYKYSFLCPRFFLTPSFIDLGLFFVFLKGQPSLEGKDELKYKNINIWSY